MGLCDLGSWPLPLPDIRCRGWDTSVRRTGHLSTRQNAHEVFRRRTHQSGPLGELFDHGEHNTLEDIGTTLMLRLGVDALNTVLEVLLFAAAMNLGQSWYTVLTLFGGQQASRHPLTTSTDAAQQLSHSTYRPGTSTTLRPSHWASSPALSKVS